MTIILDAALFIATLLTLIGLAAACGRLFLGPSRADRVVALDLITVLLVAIAALAALRFDDGAYLDLGLTLALIGFLATVAFARYVELEPVPPEGDTSERPRPTGAPDDRLESDGGSLIGEPSREDLSAEHPDERVGGKAGEPPLGHRP